MRIQSPKYDFICEYCGKKFHNCDRGPTYIPRFCSMECYRKSIYHTKICIKCGKEFSYQFGGIHRKIPVYCSRECRIKSKDTIIKCLACGKEFHVFQMGASRKFCSQTCSNRYNQPNDPSKHSVFICKWCGKHFVDWTYRNPGYCSMQCVSEYAARQLKPASRRPENFIERICIQCGEVFKIHKCQLTRIGMSQGIFCSVKCRLISHSSGPEIKCREMLEFIGMEYEFQKRIKSNFYVDFAIGNIILQVDGEYWHGHPRFEPLTDRQKSQKKRDAAQDKYLVTCGYQVIRIWERDITYEHIKSILQL